MMAGRLAGAEDKLTPVPALAAPLALRPSSQGQAEQSLPVPTRREGTPAGATHRGEAVPDPHALTPPREPIPRGYV